MSENNCGCERTNHIKCEVVNCLHHGEGDCCRAEIVKVKTCGVSESDTACVTFAPEK